VNRGEIWHVDLDPVMGHEQRGRRYVFIVSPQAFNRAMGGLALVAPITTGGGFERSRGFAVSMIGAGTQVSGVVLCGQVRTIDIKARQGRRVEQAPDFIVDEVLAKLATLIE